jgi:subtilisin family serine protease
MQVRSLVLKLEVSFLILLIACLEVAAQEQRLVFDGAVMSARGATRALSVLDSGFSGVLPRDLAAESLGSGTALVTTKKLKRQRVLSLNEETPRPYTRKDDLCKKAKTRKWIKKIGARVRCEPNNAYFSSAVPNDPLFSNQYASGLMSLPQAWDKTTGSSGVIALVIDTGVLYTHPDIAENMWVNPGEIAGDGIDNDGNGYIDDRHGINAILNTGDPLDDNGHGTHCAGIIGGLGNNGVGITGVAWSAKIAAAKFLSSSGSGSLSNAIKAINYGTALRRAGNRVVVSNNSWGGGSYSATLAAAIQASADAGILFVAAAGNAASNNDLTPSYPASYTNDNVIAVASTTSSGALSSFSNYGATSVDIAAPGSSILSTYLNDSYAYLSGTSMAAPQVSGVALLAQSICSGTLSYQEVKSSILSSGTEYPGLSGQVQTSAIVNAFGAVVAANAYCPSTPTPAPSATPTAATPSPTPISTNTPEQPTPTSTPIDTQSPTATPFPTEPALPPENTPTATPTRAPAKQPQLTVAPGALSGPAPVTISVQGGASTTSAKLRVFARDSKWAYTCPPIDLGLASGSASITVNLPADVNRMRRVDIFASVRSRTLRSGFNITSPTQSKNYRQGQAAFKAVCSAIARSVRSTAISRGR